MGIGTGKVGVKKTMRTRPLLHTFTNVVAEHRKPGWEPQPVVDLMRFEGQSNTRG